MKKLFAIAVLLSANLALAAQPARFQNKLAPCHSSGVEEEVLCGTHDVYENRAANSGRKISLHIVVLPAKSSEIAPDPLVFLAGGGVAPATRYAGYFNKAFADLNQHRDIVLIDQRGTGGSNALQCDNLPAETTDPLYRDKPRLIEAVNACRKQLESKADLRYYTTHFAMDDLDEVRDWLGYQKLNLYGVSYGTQAAMVYVRQHGERVRSIVLHGVLPLDESIWLDSPRSSQQALENVFATCAQQENCHKAFPDFQKEFSALLKQLADKPVKVKVVDPDTKTEVEVPIDSNILRIFASRSLFSAERIYALPFLIHSAYSGNYQPIAESLAPKDDSPIPKGIYFSIVCSEELQFDPAALPAATAGTFIGDLLLGRDVLACTQWTRGLLPKDFWTPVRSDIPALVMNGALDHVTPPRYGEHVAQFLTNSKRLVLPVRGHNDTDPCVASIVESFITAGSPQNLDTTCLDKTPPQSFAITEKDLENN